MAAAADLEPKIMYVHGRNDESEEMITRITLYGSNDE